MKKPADVLSNDTPTGTNYRLLIVRQPGETITRVFGTRHSLALPADAQTHRDTKVLARANIPCKPSGIGM